MNTAIRCNTSFFIFVSFLLLSSLSYASGKYHRSEDWAKVTQVEPITRMVEHRTPETHCWTEQVEYYTPQDRDHSYTSTVLGGIIGGAIGNAVGHKKKNKQIGTAVGAILGASIGSDIGSKRNHYTGSSSQLHNERRCETTHQVSYEEEVVGYKVWYRYHGQTYQTRMDHKPGKKIKVRVNVSPI